MNKYFRKDESGAALLFSIILISIMMGVGLTLSTIFVGKLRASIDAKNSVAAYYAADTGIEWDLYNKRIASEDFDDDNRLGIGSVFEIEDGDEGGINFTRSLGTYRGVSRAIEIINFEVEVTPTPPPGCPPVGDLTFTGVPSGQNSDTTTFLFTANASGTLDDGTPLIYAGGSGISQLSKAYDRTDVVQNILVGFIPDGVGLVCLTADITVPMRDAPPPPPPDCSDISPPLGIDWQVDSDTPTEIVVSFHEEDGRVGTFSPVSSPYSFPKQSQPYNVMLTFSMQYNGLTCTVSESIAVGAADPPKYEWTQVPVEPGFTESSGLGCGNIFVRTMGCRKENEGLTLRIYSYPVHDDVSTGWMNPARGDGVSGDRSLVAYRRYGNCGGTGTPTYKAPLYYLQCQNAGGPEPAPAAPPDYQWVRMANGSRFLPNLNEFVIDQANCSGAPLLENRLTCDESTLGKKIASHNIPYAREASPMFKDYGDYYHGGPVTVIDPSTVTVTGRDINFCTNIRPLSAPNKWFIGGYNPWEVWECQAAQEVFVEVDTNRPFFARILDSLIGLFKKIF